MVSRAPDCDVLIVGLGPVGAAQAALLATQGVTAIAIERDAEVYPLPRAVHFDHEIMRLFQQLGIAEQVARHSIPLPRYEFRSAHNELLFAVDPVPEAACGWVSGYMFHQPSLETALRDVVAMSPDASVRIGWRFDGLTQDADGVIASVTGPDGRSTLRARYLIGCDGASSRVREAVGGGLSDYGFDEPWLVIDVKLAAGVPLPSVNLQICDPSRPTTCVLSGPGRRRWEFMLLPGETAENVLKDDFINDLLAPWVSGPVAIERRAVYRFHGLLAKSWRAGRVLLAGDAAHQMPPFAGQGMCSGLRDAVNLAWKLEAVLHGRASPDLLDTYQVEREPHVRALIELAIGMGRAVCTLHEEEAAARDRQMLAARAAGTSALPPLRAPPFEAGCLKARSPGAGDIFPQPACGQGKRRLRLDDAMGEGAWLIGRRLPVSVTAELDARSIDEPALAPFRTALTEWLDAHDAEAVLVRPDRYVFGSGDPDSLVLAWVRALQGSPVAAKVPNQ